MKKIIFLLFFSIHSSVFSTTFTVTNTSDSGAGSLRQAMTNAQTDPTPPSLINFNIPGVVPQTITPLSTLPTIQTTTTIDGTTQQPGWVSGDDMPIVIDCTQLAMVVPAGFCFLIDSASNCLIKGLAIKSYVGGSVNGNAIRIRSTTAVANNNQINNCFFGCEADGSVLMTFTDNTRSIVVAGNTTYAVTNTIIGGPNAGDGNLLVNTSVNAVDLQFNVLNTLIQNNFFGTDKTGMIAVGGNPYDIAIFGELNGPCNNTIIRANVLANNADSTAAAINLVQNVNDTIIDNNKIGTNAAGTAALANVGMGINTFGSTGLDVNGTQIINNIISGNPTGGIVLNDLTNNSVIQGNYIGVDITGTFAIPNSVGIEIQADTGGTGFSCSNNLIGGTTSAEGNVISGNTTAGIQLADDVIATTIEGNLIGVNAADTSALPNGAGIQLLGSTDAGTPVTGTIINDNVISGNTAEGISLASSTVNSTIQANFIGTNSSGASLGNGGSGIIIEGTDGFPCTGNLIGGTSSASDGNTIEFNGAYGVEVDGNATTPDILNPILGNSIFLNANNGIELLGGGNNDQEPPTINSAAVCAMGGNTVTIGVTAPAAPAASNFRLEFFLNTVNRNPITEGQTFIGAIAPVPSGQTVIQSFTLPDGTVSVGQWVSATATNLNGAGDTPGDTSEFSLNTVFSAFTPPTITSFTADTTSIHAGGSATFTVAFTQGSNPGPFDVMWSDGATQMNVTSPFTRTVSPTSTTTYTVTIIDSVGCTDTSSPITIIVTGPVLPPNSVSGNAIRNIFLTQIDFINIITWTAPTSGAAPVTYKIYRDAALTELIATIPANGPLQYYDHDRQPGVTYSYYIVSIDSLGNVSTPININITS